MLTVTDQKLLTDTIIETIEPYYVQLMNSFDGYDRKIEQINCSMDALNKSRCAADTVKSGIKNLLSDIKIHMDKMDFRLMFVDIRLDKAMSTKEYSEFRLDISLLKDRVTRLEKLIGRVCEAEEKYKS